MANSSWTTVKTTLIVLATVGVVVLVACGGGLVLLRMGWPTVKDHMAGGLSDDLQATPLQPGEHSVTWSWDREDVPYTVQPANETFYKSGPDLEHRYFNLTHPPETDPKVVEAAAMEVWRHFADEVERQNAAAAQKLVIGWIFIEGQDDPSIPAGRVSNEPAALKLTEEPSIWWNEVIESSLVFE